MGNLAAFPTWKKVVILTLLIGALAGIMYFNYAYNGYL